MCGLLGNIFSGPSRADNIVSSQCSNTLFSICIRPATLCVCVCVYGQIKLQVLSLSLLFSPSTLATPHILAPPLQFPSVSSAALLITSCRPLTPFVLITAGFQLIQSKLEIQAAFKITGYLLFVLFEWAGTKASLFVSRLTVASSALIWNDKAAW